MHYNYKMISEYTKSDTSKILHIINDASLRYKGIIPDNCWKEPYMSEKELVDEFCEGTQIFGYHYYNKLIGIMGVQKVKDVILIISEFAAEDERVILVPLAAE